MNILMEGINLREAYMGTCKIKNPSTTTNITENMYEKFCWSSYVGVLVHQAGKALYCNDQFMEYIKCFSSEQFIGNPILEIVHPDYRKRVVTRINKVLQKKR